MKVCWIPLNVDGAGCYRMIFPMAYLADQGFDTCFPSFLMFSEGRQVKPLEGQRGLLAQIPNGNLEISFIQDTVPLDCDVYVFQLGSPSWMVDWARWIRRENPTAKILLDMDDDLHRVPKYNPARLDKVSSPTNNRRNAQTMLELSDGASFATQALADFYGRWQSNARVIPNYLHWPMWEALPPVFERRDWQAFRVGYMGNTDFHRADLETVAAPLSRWLRSHPDTEFVAAGDPRIHDVLGVPEAQRVSTSLCFFRALDLPYITSCMDIGLVPLARNVFNDGKSALKGMEQAACGIPSICTPTPEYRRWMGNDFSPGGSLAGWLAATPKAFIAALDQAYENRDLLENKAKWAYQQAREHSLDRRIHEWADWLTGFGSGDNPDHQRSGTLVAGVR